MASKVFYTIGAITSSAAVAWTLKSSFENKRNSPVNDALCATVTKNEGQGLTLTASQPPQGLEDRIAKAKELILRIKNEVGAPGIVVGVSIDGKVVWKSGFGYSDVEKRSRCHGDTVMRIASISKSLTMTLVARLWEEGQLDLDAPVQQYVPSFPKKTVDGKQVEVTTRQLVSHLAGIRHYVKKGEKAEGELTPPKDDNGSTRTREVYNKERFDTMEKALALFKDDELMSKPGTEYLYTTHGWTLVSAVVEGAGKEKFTKQAKKLFMELGLQDTRLDEPDPIIYNRASYYRTFHGRLVNAPFSDNSYKWAGGGFLSTVGDLLKFAHIMLYSYQWQPNLTAENGKLVQKYITDKPQHPLPSLPPGFLKPETVKTLWTPVPLTKGIANGLRYRDDGYGMGWQVAPYRAAHGGGTDQLFQACHSGAAVGASSVLYVLPDPSSNSDTVPPRGVCVAILTNMQDVGLITTAEKVARIFADMKN